MKPTDQTILHGGQVPGNCLQAAVASILELPLEAVPHFVLFGSKWADALWTFLGELGYDVHVKANREFCPRDYCLMSGQSPRGDFLHVVVALGGEMVHNPHPSRAGLAGFTDYIWWMPKAQNRDGT